jgi:ribosome-binding factor A
MDSTRQLKVSRLIQKEIGEIFQRETRIFFGNALITVTQVRVSPDLSVAKVYVSLFNVPDVQTLLKLIQVHTKEIRSKLSERIKKQVRIIPNLVFFIDDSLDYAMRIDELLKPPTPKGE